MATETSKHRNDWGRWFILACICAGGSTGGTMLRPHNPNITTEAWIKMQLDVEGLGEKLKVLGEQVRELVRRLPQQP